MVGFRAPVWSPHLMGTHPSSPRRRAGQSCGCLRGSEVGCGDCLPGKGTREVLGCQGNYISLSLQLPTKHVWLTFHHVGAQKKSSSGEKTAEPCKVGELATLGRERKRALYQSWSMM